MQIQIYWVAMLFLYQSTTSYGDSNITRNVI